MKCDELKSLKNIEVAYNTTTDHDQVIAEDSEGNCYGFDSWEEVYLKDSVDEAIAELKTKLVEQEVENRRLKRALWMTRAAMAKSEKDRWNAHIDCGNRRNRKDPAYVKTGKLLKVSEWRKLWADNERKCRAKAEEYK